MVLVYGWGSKPKPLGMTEPRDCGRCGNFGPWLVYKMQKEFKLYWVPVAKWGTKFRVECAICPSGAEVSEADARRQIVVTEAEINEWERSGRPPAGMGGGSGRSGAGGRTSTGSSAASGGSSSGGAGAHGGDSQAAAFHLAVAAVLHAGAVEGGKGSPEWLRARALLVEIAEGAVSEARADEMLARAQLSDVKPFQFERDDLLVLFGLAVEVALADGAVSAAERAKLVSLADRLLLSREVVDVVIDHLSGGDDRQAACEILGVAVSASVAEIRVTYRRLAVEHHPDRAPAAERAAATQRMSQINAAYDFLIGKSARL